MRRLNSEAGATAVLMAIMLVPLLGIGALVIDAGFIYYEVRQLQNGADAAALAIAQDCVEGNCGTYSATADFFTDANASDDAANALVQLPGDDGANSVTVTASTRSGDGSDSLTYFLAGVLENVFGADFNATFARSATARWGAFGGGATIPLTFSECEWDILTGGDVNNLPTGERTVYFHSSKAAEDLNTCGGPANQDHPGGFGWLSSDGSDTPCTATVSMGTISTDTGNNVPNDCTEAYFKQLIGGDPVIMPIFSHVTDKDGKDKGNGSNAEYNIIGFAAIEVTGYRFSGSKYTENAPCSNPDRCISARFVAYYDLGAEPTGGGTEYGAYVIGLTG
jgi:Flp pilus assembly protein TadG